VKQFAQMMIEEHQKAISQLQKAAPSVANMNLKLTSSNANASAASAGTTSDPARAGEARSASTQSGSPAAANQRTSASDGQGGSEDSQMIQLARETKQECLNLTQTELGRKQGDKFDKAYIGQQLVAHTTMLAQLRAAQRHVSGQLQPILQQGVQMTEHHLAQARQIMEQLDAGGGQEAAARPGAANPPRR
jgi:predicted outer membrane protein